MAQRKKNLLGKSRSTQNPYAIWKGYGPFGETEIRLLKTYQLPDKEKTNQYARWMIAAKSDMTYGSYDMGDSYIKEATYGLTLTWADDLYKEQYGLVTDDPSVDDKILHDLGYTAAELIHPNGV